jgi:hypothetical protein
LCLALASTSSWLFPALKMCLKGTGVSTMEDIMEWHGRTPECPQRRLPPVLQTMSGSMK